MCGHIAFVKGRGAAAALGAAFAMDPAMMAIGCVPLVGGSLLHRHAEAVTVTALSLPLISLALHRSPRRALGPLALITVIFARAPHGVAPGGGWPTTSEVWWNRFWVDRDREGGAPMRIGLVSPYSWTVPGGVNHHVEHLAAELEARGHEPWIIAPVGALTPARRSVDSRRQPMAERFIPMGAAVPVPSNGSLAYVNLSPQCVTRMDRAVRYGRFDVLHVHEPCTPLVAGAAVLMAASPVVGTFHAALECSALRRLQAACRRRRAPPRRAHRRERGGARVPAEQVPGRLPDHPQRSARSRSTRPPWARRRTRGGSSSSGARSAARGSACSSTRSRACASSSPHVSLVIAGATRKQILEAARDGYDLPLDLSGVEALGWVDDDEKVAQLGRGRGGLRAVAGGRELRHRAGRGDGGGRAGRRLRPPRLPRRAARRAGRAAGAARRPRRARRRAARPAAKTARSGGGSPPPASPPRPTSPGAASPATSSRPTRTPIAAPQVRGVHGLPGRPWFGRAVAEYGVWATRSGYSARRARARGAGPLTAPGRLRRAARGGRGGVTLLDRPARPCARPVWPHRDPCARPAVSFSRGRSSVWFRAPACHAGGRGFEPRRSRHSRLPPLPPRDSALSTASVPSSTCLRRASRGSDRRRRRGSASCRSARARCPARRAASCRLRRRGRTGPCARPRLAA